MDGLDDALKLLEDNNLVWSSDFEAIRLDLAVLLEKAAKLESLTNEINELTDKLVREGSNNARRLETEEERASL